MKLIELSSSCPSVPSLHSYHIPLIAHSQLSTACGFVYRINRDKWPIKLPLCSFSFSFTCIAISAFHSCSPFLLHFCRFCASLNMQFTNISETTHVILCTVHLFRSAPVDRSKHTDSQVFHLWNCSEFSRTRKLGAQMPSTGLPIHQSYMYYIILYGVWLVIDTHSYAFVSRKNIFLLLAS